MPLIQWIMQNLPSGGGGSLYTENLGETVTPFSESVGTVMVMATPVAETVTPFSESVGTVVTLAGDLSETVALSDALASSGLLGSPLSEVLTWLEQVSINPAVYDTRYLRGPRPHVPPWPYSYRLRVDVDQQDRNVETLEDRRVAYAFDDGGPVSLATFQKDPDETLDYTFDWSTYMHQLNDRIVSVIWSHSGLTSGSSAFGNDTATIWLSGGTAGTTYTVTCQVTTEGGRVAVRSIIIQVLDL